MPSNVENGKAFEFAIAYEYVRYLTHAGYPTRIIEDEPFHTAKKCLEQFNAEDKEKYLLSARATIQSMMKLEPGFTSPKNQKDIMTIRIAADNEGEDGDVRDVIFARPVSNWELGFSAKNNNDAVKHSRLSSSIDFGQKWLDYPVSEVYWNKVRPIFAHLANLKEQGIIWREIEADKPGIYKAVLDAFRQEIMRLAAEHDDVPQKLILYLLGEKPFYKIIKEDSSSMVVVKAFNLFGELNKVVNGNHPKYKTKKVNLPTRIVEFDYKIKQDGSRSDNTLNMILDNGWEISFRLHSAETKVIPSLKFDVQLLGNPPILFTQYIFQED